MFAVLLGPLLFGNFGFWIISQAGIHPKLEIFFAFIAFGIHIAITIKQSAAHDHGLNSALIMVLFCFFWVKTAHQLVLTYIDAHFAIYQKGYPAEHCLFFYFQFSMLCQVCSHGIC